jgi:Asp-tRNA(Asn)/Glu-tRNA(Gln) amidotransferase A subunit family amidase
MMKDFDSIQNNHNTIVAKEAAEVHKDWYEAYSELYHPKTAELILRGQKVTERDYNQALAGREKLRDAFSTAMAENKIDLWLSPGASGPAPKGLESTGDPVMNLPWTYSGLPTLCLPSGRNHTGLPLGLQIAGEWYRDENFLDWTNKIEYDIAGEKND